MDRLGPCGLDSIATGDCIDVMKELPNGCVDLVVADPPFNVNYDYSNGLDDNLPLGEYLDWLEVVMRQAERICREGRLLFLWQAMPHCLPAWNRFPQARLMAGCKDFVQLRKVDVQWATDPILFWHKGSTRYDFASSGGQMGSRRDWVVGNHMAERLLGEGSWHPCPRPMAHLWYIIGQWSNPGDVIFDPFMGSGTTAVAAKKLGRHFFGCDINPEYVELARERVAKIDGVQLELHMPVQAAVSA